MQWVGPAAKRLVSCDCNTSMTENSLFGLFFCKVSRPVFWLSGLQQTNKQTNNGWSNPSEPTCCADIPIRYVTPYIPPHFILQSRATADTLVATSCTPRSPQPIPVAPPPFAASLHTFLTTKGLLCVHASISASKESRTWREERRLGQWHGRCPAVDKQCGTHLDHLHSSPATPARCRPPLPPGSPCLRRMRQQSPQPS